MSAKHPTRGERLAKALSAGNVPFRRDVRSEFGEVFFVPLTKDLEAEARIVGADIVLYVRELGAARFRASLTTVGDVVALVASWKRRARKGEVL